MNRYNKKVKGKNTRNKLLPTIILALTLILVMFLIQLPNIIAVSRVNSEHIKVNSNITQETKTSITKK